MTDEGKKDTESWIQSKGVKYAYGYDKGGRLKGQLGVSGIPHAFLVDPSGKIIWEGHPGSLPDDVISKALAGSLSKPMWEWPANAKGVRAALAKHKYGDALAEAGKLSEADMGPTIKSAVQGIVAGRVQAMKAALDAGNFLQAQESADVLSKELEGLPELADAKTTLDAIKANKDAERVIKGQKKVHDIKTGKLGTKKDMDKAMAELGKMVKEYSGTVAEKEAKALLDEIMAKKRESK